MVGRRSWGGTKLWRRLAVLVAVLLALAATVPGLAQTGPNTMNFQGRLLDDGGNPLGGVTRCMEFSICADGSSHLACVNTNLWGPEVKAVTTANGSYKAGLFTVVLGEGAALPPDLFYDYDTLYLEIGVSDSIMFCGSASYTPMEPRSELKASAFAQRSRRVRTWETDDDYLVHVSNIGTGGAVYGYSQNNYGISGDSTNSHGVHGESETGPGVSGTSPTTGTVGIATSGSGVTYGLYGRNASFSGAGVYGTSDYGSGTGVRGESSGGPGVYGTSASGNALEGASASGNGVWGSSTSGSGLHGTASMTGTVGIATGGSGTTYGVYGRNTSPSGAGVYGTSSHATGLGVHGQSTAGGDGVRGTSISGTGVRGASTSGYGVYGASTSSYGVYSEGNAHVAGNLTWQAKTGYISIAPAAFHPAKDGVSYINDGHTLRNPGLTGGVRRHYYAPVQLPHGATITRFTIHYHAGRELPEPIDGPCPPPGVTPDDGLCVNGRIGLLRTDFTGMSGEQFLTEVWEVATPVGENGTNWTQGISYATVDNDNYAYYVWAGIVADGFWLTGAQIEYQFSEPY